MSIYLKLKQHLVMRSFNFIVKIFTQVASHLPYLLVVALQLQLLAVAQLEPLAIRLQLVAGPLQLVTVQLVVALESLLVAYLPYQVHHLAFIPCLLPFELDVASRPMACHPLDHIAIDIAFSCH
jgi:hypothetical protein